MASSRFRHPWVIVNPRAATGKAGRQWPKLRPVIESALGPVGVRMTEAPNHATDLAREVLADGADLVVALGGDGTINEVVNGFFQDGSAIPGDASLAVCPVGTGGDFRRSAGIPQSPKEAVRAIAGQVPRRVDVCKVSLTSHAGESVDRYFINITSFGLGGEVSVTAKQSALARYSGNAAFLWATVVSLARFRGKAVTLGLGQNRTERGLRIMQVALGNGAYHGGGMCVCPDARIDSGQLEVTVIEKIGLFEFLRSLPLLYSGRIYTHPKCHRYRAKSVSADSDERVAVEVDGEAIGTLPLRVEILPSALKLAGMTGAAPAKVQPSPAASRLGTSIAEAPTIAEA